MKQLINIFDLDATLIDSSHRINKDGNIDGGLNLSYWLEHNTKENIMNDKLLPLVNLFKEFQKTNFTNIAVTARVMSDDDFEFLHINGLHFNMILHRENSIELDHILKEKKLQELFSNENYMPFLAFDDKAENLEVFSKFGFKCFNAIELNKILSNYM